MKYILEKQLLEKISSKKAIVGIIGLGYVGGALAMLIAKKGYEVQGFEKNKEKITTIRKEQIKNLSATDDMSRLSACDIVIVCIQTPILEDKTPDLRFLEIAMQEIRKHLHEGQLITIESSINPGVTRFVALPILEASGISIENFFLSFSPERIDPGNREYPLETIPKVVSGINTSSLHLIQEFYQRIFKTVVPVSSLETAEMVKIFENTFRFINISLTNELKEYAQHIGVDMWEVVRAASTKPFGFLPHYPGPGAGGHCIPVDPFYLYFDAQKRGIELSFIRLAGIINDKQPYTIVEQSLLILRSLHAPFGLLQPLEAYRYPQPLKQQKVGMKGGTTKRPSYNVLLIGVAYKANIDDIRESPALKVWELFLRLGHRVSYHDPYIKHVGQSSSIPLNNDTLTTYDIYVIITNHANIDYEYLTSFGKPIIDTQHAYTAKYPNVYYI